PHQEGACVLEGQPAEGGARGRARLGRGTADPRRTDLRTRPADGSRVPGGDQAGTGPGTHGAAVEPHPVRGRGPVRSREHHQSGQDRRVRHARAAAAPHPHHRHRRSGGTARRPHPARGRARPSDRRAPGALRRRNGRFERGTARSGRHRRAQPHQSTTDAGGAVPASLHRRTRRRGEGVMTGDDARTPADSGTLRSPKSTGEPSETTPTAGNLSGTGQLTRLALRRDRLVLPLWIVVVVLLTTAGAGAYEQLYPDPAERAALTAGMANNPSITLLLGPAYDLSTAGGFTAWRFGTMLSLLLALVCVFTMTRHTRQEEETGRYELLSSTVVGRYAFLAASSVVCAAFAALTGLATASALIAAGTSASGAFAFGLGLTSV